MQKQREGCGCLDPVLPQCCCRSSRRRKDAEVSRSKYKRQSIPRATDTSTSDTARPVSRCTHNYFFVVPSSEDEVTALVPDLGDDPELSLKSGLVTFASPYLLGDLLLPLFLPSLQLPILVTKTDRVRREEKVVGRV